MKSLLLIAAALATAISASAETYITEDITTNTTWTVAGSPYIVQGVIGVEDPSTLTIEPGVVVKMDSVAHLRPNNGGVLHAVGTEGNEILFTSAQDTPAPNDWWGVVMNRSSASVVSHCIFEYGRYNLYADHSDPTISNCTSRYASTAAFMCEDSSPNITDCEALDSNQGVRLSGTASPVITGCTLADNVTGVYVNGPDQFPVIHNCNIYDNTSENLYVRGYTELPLVTIDAEDNWWGVDTDVEIEQTINIASSSVGYVEVDYDPWLHEAPVEEVSWGRVKALFAE
jgi:parallel beta-helix repeat protein